MGSPGQLVHSSLQDTCPLCRLQLCHIHEALRGLLPGQPPLQLGCHGHRLTLQCALQLAAELLRVPASHAQPFVVHHRVVPQNCIAWQHTFLQLSWGGCWLRVSKDLCSSLRMCSSAFLPKVHWLGVDQQEMAAAAIAGCSLHASICKGMLEPDARVPTLLAAEVRTGLQTQGCLVQLRLDNRGLVIVPGHSRCRFVSKPGWTSDKTDDE